MAQKGHICKSEDMESIHPDHLFAIPPTKGTPNLFQSSVVRHADMEMPVRKEEMYTASKKRAQHIRLSHTEKQAPGQTEGRRVRETGQELSNFGSHEKELKRQSGKT